MQNIWNSQDFENTANSIAGAVSGALGKIDTDISNMESSLNTKLDTEFSELNTTLEKEFSNKTDNKLLENINTNIESYVNTVMGTEGQFGKLIEVVQEIATILMNWNVNGTNTQGNVLPNNTDNTDNIGTIPETPSTSETNTTPSVGDKLTSVTGRWYHTSLGGDNGAVDILGADSWEITKINDGSKYPYHLVGYNNGKETGSGWVDLDSLPGYATGLKQANKEHLAWTHDGEAIITKDGAVLTRVNLYDMILTKQATNNLWDAMNDPSRFIQNYMPNVNMPTNLPIPNRNVANNVENHFDKIEFVLPNVKNYNEFMTEMQHDRKFEKMIQDMSINRLAGGSSVDKYRYRW